MKNICVGAIVLLVASGPALAQEAAYRDVMESAFARPSANAAPAPVIAFPPVSSTTAAVGRWSGFTFGAQWGVGAGSSVWSHPTGLIGLIGANMPATAIMSGSFGGANIGYGWQVRNFHFGVEAEASAASIRGTTACGGAFGSGFGWTCETRSDIVSSLGLRGGVVEGDALFYGKVGVAHEKDGGSIISCDCVMPPIQTATSQNRFGLALGGGVDVALDDHWSLRLEYDHYGFGTHSFSSLESYYLYPNGASYNLSENIVKAGVNYRLGDPSAAAAPLRLAVLDDLTAEVGARAGFTSGGFAKNLYDPYAAGQLNSRLNWTDQNGAPIETFVRVDHKSGVFVNTMIGGSALAGHMTDEDFPPSASAYSKTVSASGNGRTLYSTADLGYDVLKNARYRLGGFVGYSFYQQDLNAFSCTQTQAASTVCAAGTVPDGRIVASQNERWNAVRLGVGGDVNVTSQLNLAAEAAWLPYAHRSATDNHWLRPEIDPVQENGSSHSGVQLQGVASYLVTDRLSLGLGARYWTFGAPAGSALFPFAGARSPETFNSDRATVFMQLETKLGALEHRKTASAAKY